MHYNSIMDDMDLIGGNAVIFNRNIFRPLADGNDPISFHHSLFFNIKYLRIDVLTGAIPFCCMDMNNQWFATCIPGGDSCGKGHPVMTMDYVKRILTSEYLTDFSILK